MSGWMNVYGHTYAADPGVASTNNLPPTRLTLHGGSTLVSYSRGSWAAFSADFELAEGSRIAICTMFESIGGSVVAKTLVCEGTIRVGTLATSTIRLTSGNSGIVGFVLDGMFDARVPGTVTIEGEMLSKDRGVYEIATIDGCIGTSALVRWCVQGSAIPSGWAGHLEIVDGNRLVVRLVPRGGWIILK